MAFYFAFGSNMRTSRMEERICEGTFHTPIVGRLHHYRLEFSKTPGYASIHRTPDSVVYGAAYSMNEAAFCELDTCEGCFSAQTIPDGMEPAWSGHYFRMECTIEVLMKSEWVSAPAVTYKAHAHMTKDGLQPSDEYLGHLLAGQDLLRSCDEGAAYVDIIKGVAQRPSTIEEEPYKGRVHPPPGSPSPSDWIGGCYGESPEEQLTLPCAVEAGTTASQMQ